MSVRTLRASRWQTTLLAGAAVALASVPMLSHAQEEAQPAEPAATEQAAPAEPAATEQVAQAEPAAPAEEPAAEPEAAPAPAPAAEPAPAPEPAVAPAPAPAPAAAAAAPAKKGEGVEEIVVTGSRIGRSNLEEYGHISVVSGDQLERSGVTTVDELLIELPSVSLQGINKNQNNGGEGLAFVDLRNLGTNRTLVLVNGRRFVTSGTGVGEAVDLNNIPVQLIDRVEVLLDGASAVYGSDAIGGVVNIILKDDFEGLQLDAHTGMSTYGDGAEVSLAATMGGNFDRGNMVFNATFLDRQQIAQKDRGWAKDPVLDADTNADGSINLYYGSSYVPDGRIGCDRFTPDPNTGASFSDFCGPYFAGNDPNAGYNYGSAQWLIGKQQRWSLTTLANYDLTANMKAYMEGTFTHRHSRQRLAPQPAGGANSTWSGFAISVDNPYMPADYRATLDPATQYVNMNRRMTDVGNRIYDNYNETFRLVTGVKGDLLDKYHWDVFFNYGLNRQNHEIKNSINYTKLRETADPQLCALNAARGCVVGNYFGEGALQPEVADYIRYTDVQTSGYQHVSGGASITGDIVELPAGGLGFAAGVEHRDEQGFTRPDSVVQGGDSAGNGLDPTKGGYYVTEAFGELSVPLLKGVLGADDVTLDIAGRYSDYSTFGSDTTYRVGLSYAPIPDVRVRGVLSTAFRAPAISDLYGGAADSYETLSDPCSNWDTTLDPASNAYQNCQAAGVPAGYSQASTTGSQIRTNIGGSPDLQEETAQVMTAGVVITPRMVEGLALTADYYNITVDNAIDATPRQYMLNTCYDSSNLSSPYCSRITRGVQGEVSLLVATLENIGKLRTQGMDFTANYRFDLGMLGLPGIGRVDIGWQGNYLIKYEQEFLGDTQEFAGFWQTNYGTFSKWRWIQPLTFSRDTWSVTSMVRYTGGADYYLPEDYWPDAYKKVDAVYYWDLSGKYTYDNLTLIVGINNVLNRDPPFILEGGQNADPASYDFVGRFFFANASYKF